MFLALPLRSLDDVRCLSRALHQLAIVQRLGDNSRSLKLTFSATAYTVELVCEPGIIGMIEASTIRRPSTYMDAYRGQQCLRKGVGFGGLSNSLNCL